MKTGILGGTFNPIHLAHLRIAEEAFAACRLDRLIFIPAAEPPHKQVAGQMSFAHRFAMVQAAISGIPGFCASDLEIRRSGKSFSVDTLEILRLEDPEGERYFIVGLDSYRDISSWKEYRRLFRLCNLVVTTRPGVVVDSPLDPLPVAVRGEFCYDEFSGNYRHQSGNLLIFLEETRLDIASSQIRDLLAAGQSIRHLVPSGVADYIQEHGLYLSPTA